MDFQMDCILDEEQQRWMVTLSGEIDIFSSARLKKDLNELLEQKAADLYLNCKMLEYIDSTGLGALVGVMKTVKHNGREMHLVAVKPNIARLFRITKLDRVFTIEEACADA